MIWLESTKCKITKNKSDENFLYLDITEVVLAHCNIHDSRALHNFFPNKSFGQLLNIKSKHFIYWKTFSSEI